MEQRQEYVLDSPPTHFPHNSCKMTTHLKLLEEQHGFQESRGSPKGPSVCHQARAYTGVAVMGAAVHGGWEGGGDTGGGGGRWHWSLMPCWIAPGPKEDGQHCRSPLLPLATVGQMDSGTLEDAHRQTVGRHSLRSPAGPHQEGGHVCRRQSR